MADKKNILVFPAGTEIAFEIHDALCRSKFVKLFGATSVPCHAEFVFENCAEGVPFPDQPGFLEAMNRVVDEFQIDYIYPAHDSALLALTRLQDRLHAQVVTSPLETVEICRDKNRTYAFLAGADYLPASYADADAVPGYPVFIKPAVGQGAQGARRIDSRAQLEEALADGTDYAICEYLPGEEYTVDCFTDRHGQLRLVSPRSRERIRAGIAVRSRNLPEDPAITAIGEDLNLLPGRLVFPDQEKPQRRMEADGGRPPGGRHHGSHPEPGRESPPADAVRPLGLRGGPAAERAGADAGPGLHHPLPERSAVSEGLCGL